MAGETIHVAMRAVDDCAVASLACALDIPYGVAIAALGSRRPIFLTELIPVIRNMGFWTRFEPTPGIIPTAITRAIVQIEEHLIVVDRVPHFHVHDPAKAVELDNIEELYWGGTFLWLPIVAGRKRG